MYEKIFCKNLSPLGCEEELLTEVLSAGDKIWWTARNNADNSLTFVKDKPSGGFYLSRLKRFPKIIAAVLERFPDAIIENSYVTKCLPDYKMIPHIDPGRRTAVIIPLSENKGKISFYAKGIRLCTHTYTGPAMTRVNIMHGAENNSTEVRYALTIEIPGGYFYNYFNR